VSLIRALIQATPPIRAHTQAIPPIRAHTQAIPLIATRPLIRQPQHPLRWSTIQATHHHTFLLPHLLRWSMIHHILPSQARTARIRHPPLVLTAPLCTTLNTTAHRPVHLPLLCTTRSITRLPAQRPSPAILFGILRTLPSLQTHTAHLCTILTTLRRLAQPASPATLSGIHITSPTQQPASLSHITQLLPSSQVSTFEATMSF
jgi:hypothetical protein